MADLFVPAPDPVAVNERGYRIGEGHQRAVLTDREVDMMRDQYEAGGIGYRRLAKQYNCAATTVRKIVNYETRAQTPDGFRRPR